jgi:hypothetical protein
MSGIQTKISPLLGVAMALDASIYQTRTNFLFKKLDRFGRKRLVLSRLHAKYHRFNNGHQQENAYQKVPAKQERAVLVPRET